MEYKNSKIGIRKLESPNVRQNAYLDHGHRAGIASRGTAKEESVSLDMQVGKTIGHHKDRWGIPAWLPDVALGCRYLFLGRVFGPPTQREIAGIIPEFYLSKKCLCVGSFVRTSVALFISIVFSNDSVPSRREHEEIGDHFCCYCWWCWRLCVSVSVGFVRWCVHLVSNDACLLFCPAK